MIENELKYVLQPSMYTEALQKLIPEMKDLYRYQLRQYYLQGHGRVRASESEYYNNTIYTFTYKVDLVSGDVEEFEMDITETAFDRASVTSKSSLVKVRYTYKEPGADWYWDIDFFIRPHDGTVYFAMAECEMPEGMEEPPSVPTFITNRLIYAVPRYETSVFSSRKMTDIAYAERILQELMDGVYEEYT